MTIILPFAGGVIDYLAEAIKCSWNTPDLCPNCNGRTYRHGKYLRTVYSHTECFIIPVFRRRCPSCKVSFSFIPSFIKPYARFLNSYRYELLDRHVLQGISIKQTPCVSRGENTISITTFRRWLNKLKKIASEANKHLALKLLDLRPGSSFPKDLSDVEFALPLPLLFT